MRLACRTQVPQQHSTLNTPTLTTRRRQFEKRSNQRESAVLIKASQQRVKLSWSRVPFLSLWLSLQPCLGQRVRRRFKSSPTLDIQPLELLSFQAPDFQHPIHCSYPATTTMATTLISRTILTEMDLQTTLLPTHWQLLPLLWLLEPFSNLSWWTIERWHVIITIQKNYGICYRLIPTTLLHQDLEHRRR